MSVSGQHAAGSSRIHPQGKSGSAVFLPYKALCSRTATFTSVKTNLLPAVVILFCRLQALCKQPAILPAAMDRLRHSESAELRLLAAQTVRKQCRVFWRRLSPQVLIPISSPLPDSALAECLDLLGTMSAMDTTIGLCQDSLPVFSQFSWIPRLLLSQYHLLQSCLHLQCCTVFSN